MTTELDLAKKAIVMKSGLTFWVAAETANKIESAVTSPEFQHQFVNIAELKQTINTSQIEGFYSSETMMDLERIKRGEKKCAYGNFHKKIEDCDCLREARRKQQEHKARRERDDENKGVSPEERARLYEKNVHDTEIRALDGGSIWRSMFASNSRSGRRMRMKTVREWEKLNGRKADLTGITLETPAKVAKPT